MDDRNPFEELDLDPAMSPEELTAELRRRVERASESERAELQRAWRALTLRDEERVRLALLTHPRSESGLDPIAGLRNSVPPYLSRRKPDALTVRVTDAIAEVDTPATVPSPPNPWKPSKSRS